MMEFSHGRQRQMPVSVPGAPPRPRCRPKPANRSPVATNRIYSADMRASGLTRSAGQLGLLLALVSGCERRAPGPDECLRFAEAWFPRREPVSARKPVAADQDFDEMVRRCLTEPYDRTLVDCVLGGNNREGCRIAYLRRAEAQRSDSAR